MNNTFKRWMNELQRNGKASCFICGEDDQAVIRKAEKHHIHGRANSPVTIHVCLNCHMKINKHQNNMPPKKRSSNASELEKALYQLTSHGALLKVMGESTIKLAEKLRKKK